MIRIICLLVGLIGILLTARTVKSPFWNQTVFGEKIMEMQKEGEYLPYRIRKYIWPKEIAAVKMEIERIINVLWFDKWVTLAGVVLVYPLILGINKRMWPEIVIIITIVSIGVMANNPNPGYFMKFTLLPLFSVIIGGIKIWRKKLLSE